MVISKKHLSWASLAKKRRGTPLFCYLLPYFRVQTAPHLLPHKTPFLPQFLFVPILETKNADDESKALSDRRRGTGAAGGGGAGGRIQRKNRRTKKNQRREEQRGGAGIREVQRGGVQSEIAAEWKRRGEVLGGVGGGEAGGGRNEVLLEDLGE